MIKNINRVEGGKRGRAQGFNHEDFILCLLKDSLSLCQSIMKLKYDDKNFGNFSKFHIKKMNKKNFPNIIDDKRAADIIIIYEDMNKYRVGIDVKMSGAQLVRKRIPAFLEKADNETKNVFEKYFAYKKDSKGDFVRRNRSAIRVCGAKHCSKDDKKKIFKFIEDEKYLMIKKRWDEENEFTWCDLLLTTSYSESKKDIWKNYINDFENNLDNRKNQLAGIKIKLLKVDDLLNKDITFERMNAGNRENYQFGPSLEFKPYGASEPDLQFKLTNRAFEKNELTIQFDLEGKRIN